MSAQYIRRRARLRARYIDRLVQYIIIISVVLTPETKPRRQTRRPPRPAARPRPAPLSATRNSSDSAPVLRRCAGARSQRSHPRESGHTTETGATARSRSSAPASWALRGGAPTPHAPASCGMPNPRRWRCSVPAQTQSTRSCEHAREAMRSSERHARAVIPASSTRSTRSCSPAGWPTARSATAGGSGSCETDPPPPSASATIGVSVSIAMVRARVVHGFDGAA